MTDKMGTSWIFQMIEMRLNVIMCCFLGISQVILPNTASYDVMSRYINSKKKKMTAIKCLGDKQPETAVSRIQRLKKIEEFEKGSIYRTAM